MDDNFKYFRPKLLVILGPSHFKILQNSCAVSPFSAVQTPLGNIKIDCELAHDLSLNESELFKKLSADDDIKEHSLEMHFPFIYKIFKNESTRMYYKKTYRRKIKGIFKK